MKHNAAAGLVLDDVGESLATSSGSLLMIEAIRVAGLGSGLSSALAPWRPTRAHHDPGKVLLDVAIAVALGGDCLADVAAMRAQTCCSGPWHPTRPFHGYSRRWPPTPPPQTLR